MDQIPVPMAIAPPVSQKYRDRPRAEVTRPARSSAAYDATIAIKTRKARQAHSCMCRSKIYLVNSCRLPCSECKRNYSAMNGKIAGVTARIPFEFGKTTASTFCENTIERKKMPDGPTKICQIRPKGVASRTFGPMARERKGARTRRYTVHSGTVPNL